MGTTIKLSNIPTVPSKGAFGIYRKRIYRTEGDGSTFKLLTEYGETLHGDYNDSTADGSLGAEYTAISTEDHPSRVWYSNIDEISSFPTANYVDVYPDDGDEITGIIDKEYGLLIFKTNSICRLYTQGSPQNWRLTREVDYMGCDTPKSIREAKGRVYFMKHGHVFRYPDALETPLSITIQDSINNVTVYDSAYSIKHSWYILVCGDRVLIFDEKVNSWYYFEAFDDDGVNFNFRCATEKQYGTYAGNIIFGCNLHDKLMYYIESGTLDYDDGDGSATVEIIPDLKTKTYTFPEGVGTIRLRKLFSDYKKKDNNAGQGYTNPVRHYLKDEDDHTYRQRTDIVNSTLASDYKNYAEVTDGMSGDAEVVNKLSYEISGAGLAEFNSAKIKYRPLKRGKR